MRHRNSGGGCSLVGRRKRRKPQDSSDHVCAGGPTKRVNKKKGVERCGDDVGEAVDLCDTSPAGCSGVERDVEESAACCSALAPTSSSNALSELLDSRVGSDTAGANQKTQLISETLSVPVGKQQVQTAADRSTTSKQRKVSSSAATMAQPLIHLRQFKPDFHELQRLLDLLCSTATGEPTKSIKSWTVQNRQTVGRTVLVVVPYLDMTLFASSARRCMPFFSNLHAAGGRLFPMRNVFVERSPYCSIVQGLFAARISRPPLIKRSTEPTAPVANLTPLIKESIASHMLDESEYCNLMFPSPNILGENRMQSEWLTFGATSDPKESTAPPNVLMKKLEEDKDFVNIIAMDCEMCATCQGSELTRISLVDGELQTIYDTYVMPDNPILDYRTAWSGVGPETLQGVTTNLKQVHEDLKKHINSQTIIVGHSLENDLWAVKLTHRRVIDTTDLYPHPRSPSKWSLNQLVQSHLGVSLNRRVGHSSVDDAKATMQLALLRMRSGPLFAGTPPPPAPYPLATRFDEQPAAGSVMEDEAVAAVETLIAERASTVLPRMLPADVDDAPSRLPAAILIDSYGTSRQYPGYHLFQGVETQRTCAEDKEVGEAAVKILSSLPERQAKTRGRSVPLVTCVLRSLQRQLSRSCGIHSDALYKFDNRIQFLMRKRTELRGAPSPPVSPGEDLKAMGQGSVAESRPENSSLIESWAVTDPFAAIQQMDGPSESDFVTTPSSAKRENSTGDPTSGCTDKDDMHRDGEVAEDEANEKLLRKALSGQHEIVAKYFTALFPSEPKCRVEEALREIDAEISRIYIDGLRPGDIMIVVSGCGNAARYFTLASAKRTIDRRNPNNNYEAEAAEDATGDGRSDLSGGTVGVEDFPPLQWTPQLDTALNNARQSFINALGFVCVRSTKSHSTVRRAS